MQNLHLADIGWIALGLALYLFAISGMPSAIFRWVSDWLGRTPRRVMSRPRMARQKLRQVVHVPVPGTSTIAVDTGAPSAHMPDTHAARPGTVNIPLDITGNDLIALLAVLKQPKNGKPLSANDIADLVGGHRATVLARVKEIRSGAPAPAYAQRTPEQEQARRELELA